MQRQPAYRGPLSQEQERSRPSHDGQDACLEQQGVPVPVPRRQARYEHDPRVKRDHAVVAGAPGPVGPHPRRVGQEGGQGNHQPEREVARQEHQGDDEPFAIDCPRALLLVHRDNVGVGKRHRLDVGPVRGPPIPQVQRLLAVCANLCAQPAVVVRFLEEVLAHVPPAVGVKEHSACLVDHGELEARRQNRPDERSHGDRDRGDPEGGRRPPREHGFRFPGGPGPDRLEGAALGARAHGFVSPPAAGRRRLEIRTLTDVERARHPVGRRQLDLLDARSVYQRERLEERVRPSGCPAGGRQGARRPRVTAAALGHSVRAAPITRLFEDGVERRALLRRVVGRAPLETGELPLRGADLTGRVAVQRFGQPAEVRVAVPVQLPVRRDVQQHDRDDRQARDTRDAELEQIRHPHLLAVADQPEFQERPPDENEQHHHHGELHDGRRNRPALRSQHRALDQADHHQRLFIADRGRAARLHEQLVIDVGDRHVLHRGRARAVSEGPPRLLVAACRKQGGEAARLELENATSAREEDLPVAGREHDGVERPLLDLRGENRGEEPVQGEECLGHRGRLVGGAPEQDMKAGRRRPLVPIFRNCSRNMRDCGWQHVRGRVPPLPQDRPGEVRVADELGSRQALEDPCLCPDGVVELPGEGAEQAEVPARQVLLLANHEHPVRDGTRRQAGAHEQQAGHAQASKGASDTHGLAAWIGHLNTTRAGLRR